MARRADPTKEVIEAALAKGKSIRGAAAILLIDSQALGKHMTRLGIPRPSRKGVRLQFTKEQIAAALEEGGNPAQAGKILEVSRRTIYKYMKLHGLKSPGRRKKRRERKGKAHRHPLGRLKSEGDPRHELYPKARMHMIPVPRGWSQPVRWEGLGTRTPRAPVLGPSFGSAIPPQPIPPQFPATLSPGDPRREWYENPDVGLRELERTWKENPDVGLRELERRAAGGEPAAVARLIQTRLITYGDPLGLHAACVTLHRIVRSIVTPHGGRVGHENRRLGTWSDRCSAPNSLMLNDRFWVHVMSKGGMSHYLTVDFNLALWTATISPQPAFANELEWPHIQAMAGGVEALARGMGMEVTYGRIEPGVPYHASAAVYPQKNPPRALARRAGMRLNPGPWSRNPDVGIRELERSAAQGDVAAAERLIAALGRAGKPVPYSLRAQVFAARHPSDHLVTYPDGRTRNVTNLGWLRRQLHTHGGMTGNMIPLRFVVRSVGTSGECYLRVELSNATEPGEGPFRIDRFLHTHTFETMFADCHHLWNYLQTPLFANEPLDWDGRVGTIKPKMHESTYGHPAGSEGGPDVECYVCGRRFWSGDPDADPDHTRCPTCYAKDRRRNPFPIVPVYPYPAPFYPRVPLPPGTLVPNPDEPARRIEREALAGDLRDRARTINGRLRRGEFPMANVALAAAVAGRRDAALLDPPPYDDQYLLADRRDLVRWALTLLQLLPARNEMELMRSYRIQQWLDTGGVHLPHAADRGSRGISNDTLRMIRARSNRSLHRLVMSVIENHRIAVYQRFMDEMEGHHGDERLSPAWTLADRRGPIVRVSTDPATVGYSGLRLANASTRQAADLLGRILLREQ